MPDTFVNDNGSLRRMSEIHVNDGGNLRDIKEVYVNSGGNLRLVFQKVPPTLPPELVWTNVTKLMRSSGVSNAPGQFSITVHPQGYVSSAIDNQTINTLTGDEWSSYYPELTALTDGWTVKIDSVGTKNPVFVGLTEGVEYTLGQTRQFVMQNQVPNSEGDYGLNVTFDDQNGTVITKLVNVIITIGTPP